MVSNGQQCSAMLSNAHKGSAMLTKAQQCSVKWSKEVSEGQLFSLLKTFFKKLLSFFPLSPQIKELGAISIIWVPKNYTGVPESMKNWWCYYSPVLDLPKNWWWYYGYTYTKLAKIGCAKAPPAPPVPAPLYRDFQKCC